MAQLLLTTLTSRLRTLRTLGITIGTSCVVVAGSAAGASESRGMAQYASYTDERFVQTAKVKLEQLLSSEVFQQAVVVNGQPYVRLRSEQMEASAAKALVARALAAGYEAWFQNVSVDDSTSTSTPLAESLPVAYSESTPEPYANAATLPLAYTESLAETLPVTEVLVSGVSVTHQLPLAETFPVSNTQAVTDTLFNVDTVGAQANNSDTGNAADAANATDNGLVDLLPEGPLLGDLYPPRTEFVER